MSPRWRRFRKGPDDTLVLVLDPDEAQLLAMLPNELQEVFDSPLSDPAAERLFPRAYLDPTEEEAEAEWRAMVHPDLLRQRLDSLSTVRASLERATPAGEWIETALTPDEVQAWLGVLNDARLMLGTRLAITEAEPLIEPTDPKAGSYALYYWLTSLQTDLVDQLL
jgi:hypothetical protein